MFNLRVFRSSKPVVKRRVFSKHQPEADIKEQVRKLMSKADQGLILMVRG
ncbi:hypothetical protein HYW42_00065 [Candidatus Daviesbacteria bacterium]|nr:hypothetical protein [Candidatus Daviesbacteria bacterium]